jgi:hypothetical protein
MTRTLDQARNDQRLLSAAASHLGRNHPHYDDVQTFTARAQANIDCYLIFLGADRDTYLRDAYALQARAWLRIHNVV